MMLFREVRQAWRGLWRKPGMSVLAVLSLGVAMALNHVLWSYRSALMAEVTVPEPARLLTLTREGMPATLPDVRLDELARNNPVFEHMAGYHLTEIGCATEGEARRVMAAFVTPSYFTTLGNRPALGALPLPEEQDAVVITHDFWKTRMAMDPGVLGRRLTLSGKPFTVAAVLPHTFRGPLGIMAPRLFVSSRREMALTGSVIPKMVVGRLKPGQGRSQAIAHLKAASPVLFPPEGGGAPTVVSADRASLLPPGSEKSISLALWAVQGLFLAVLGIAMANVVCLLLVKVVDRRRDNSIHMCLGATRQALTRPFVMEGLLVALGGMLCGLGMMRLITVAALSLGQPVDLPFQLLQFQDPWSWSVIAFALTMAVVTGLLMGLLPGWQASRMALSRILNEKGSTPKASRAHRRFVLIQMSTAMVLLVLSSLFFLRLTRAMSALKGMETERLLLFEIDPSLSGNRDAQAHQRLQVALERLRGLPGLKVAATSLLTVENGGVNESDLCEVRLPGQSWEQSQPVTWAAVSPGYLDALGVQLIAGRGVQASDKAGAEDVVVVSAAYAATLWPGCSPLGKEIGFRAGTSWTRTGDTETRCRVVGVMADHGLARSSKRPPSWVLRPMAQAPVSRATMLVQTPGMPYATRATLQNALQQVDRALAMEHVRSIQEHFQSVLFGHRLAMLTFGSAGLVALVLASAGLYALMSQQVIQRRQEIGLRMALGAGWRQVTTWILWRGMKTVGLGLVFGITFSGIAAWVLASLETDIHGYVPAVLAASGLLLTIALCACLFPALRASRVQPAEALRST